MKEHQKVLRYGYSTGACAAAAATAAWLRLSRGEILPSIRLRFPDGRDRELPLLSPGPYMAAIRKDGGDDPDCTHRAVVHASIRACEREAAGPEDYLLPVGEGLVILRAVEGIGLCTRKGLDCEQGHWAINTGPRRMIAENLGRSGLASGCWLLEVGIEKGEELARHTLNEQLGILGGLSVLGTTGLVRPYSHEAYIHSIRICVRSHALTGGSGMVFCTGGRTRAGARTLLPRLPETAFVSIGDFIAESLAAACSAGMGDIFVACMPGKLCKYASGFRNTHARRTRQNMDLFRAEVGRLLPDGKSVHEALAGCPTIREALLLVPEAVRLPLLEALSRKALAELAGFCTAPADLHLLLFDFEGTFLFETAVKTAGDEAAASAVLQEEPSAEALSYDEGEQVGPSYFMEGQASR